MFFGLTDEVQRSLVADMSRSELATLIELLDLDEVPEVLRYTGTDSREALLAALDSDWREKIDYLLSFDPEIAAGLMSLDYVTVDEEAAFASVIYRVRRFEERTGRVPTIFVLVDGKSVGELPGAALSLADRDADTVSDYVTATPRIRYNREDEEVIEVFK